MTPPGDLPCFPQPCRTPPTVRSHPQNTMPSCCSRLLLALSRSRKRGLYHTSISFVVGFNQAMQPSLLCARLRGRIQRLFLTQSRSQLSLAPGCQNRCYCICQYASACDMERLISRLWFTKQTSFSNRINSGFRDAQPQQSASGGSPLSRHHLRPDLDTIFFRSRS